MEYLKYNPMRDIAKTDEDTKVRYAGLLGKAILGKDVLKDSLAADRLKSKDKYASVGIKRKKDLCDQLRLHADNLLKVNNKKEKLERNIMEVQELAKKKPDVLRENRNLGKKRAELDKMVDDMVQSNHIMDHENEIISNDIASIEKALQDEKYGRANGEIKKLESILNEYTKKTDDLEEEIKRLDMRKEEILTELDQKEPEESVASQFTTTKSEIIRKKKESLELELKKKQKDFLLLKEKIEAENAKIGVQVRRAKENLTNK